MFLSYLQIAFKIAFFMYLFFCYYSAFSSIKLPRILSPVFIELRILQGSILAPSLFLLYSSDLWSTTSHWNLVTHWQILFFWPFILLRKEIVTSFNSKVIGFKVVRNPRTQNYPFISTLGTWVNITSTFKSRMLRSLLNIMYSMYTCLHKYLNWSQKLTRFWF